MKKIVLVFPRFKYPTGDIPYGLLCIASYLKKHMELDISIWDATFNPSYQEFTKYLELKKPFAVGISVSTITYNDALKIARQAKKNNAFVFTGGPHATMMPDSLINNPSIDAVVIGEGEKTCLELIKNILSGTTTPINGAWVKYNNKIIKGNEREFIKNIDEIPFPEWDLIDMRRYMQSWFQLDAYNPSIIGTNIIASRGCPFECSFCQPVLQCLFGRKVRLRSVKNCILEIKELKKRYNIGGFWFIDDTFTTSKEWTTEFCSTLIKENINLPWGCTTRANLIDESLMVLMSKAGLVKIGIGIESANNRILNQVYNKNIEIQDVINIFDLAYKYKVKTLAFFILGAPGETREDIINTINFAASLKADECTFSLFVPIPGTHIYNKMINDGIKLSDSFDNYEYYSKQPFTGKVSIKELRKLQKNAFFRCYFKTHQWTNFLKTVTSYKGLKNLFLKLKRIL